MAMRVSGINSGIDTDAAVKELVAAYSKKSEKVTQDQTKLSWKQEIWKGLNTKVYGLYTSISNLRYSSAYSLRKVTSSDASKASVSASGNTIIGSQKLNILKTAQSAYLTGTKITTKNGGQVKSDTKLSELGVTKDATLRVNTKDSEGNETAKDIKMSADSTVDDFVKQLQEAGLNASFDEGNGRLFISSKNSGANGDFTITAADTKEIPMFDMGALVKDKDGNVLYETVAAKSTDIAAANSMLSFLGISQESSLVGSDVVMSSKTVPMSQNATMANLGYKGTDTEIDVKGADGERIGTIKIGSLTTMKDITNQLKNMGINANFDIQTTKDADGKDVKTGRFTFQGADGLSFAAADSDGLSALGKLGLSSGAASVAGKTAASSTTMQDLGFNGTTTTSIRFKVAGDNTEQIALINPTDSIQAVIDEFRSLGVSVSYDEVSGKLSFDHEVTFSSTDKNEEDLLLKLGLESGSSKNVNTIRLPGSYAVGSDKLVSDMGLQAGSTIRFTNPDGVEKSITIDENTTMDIMVQAFKNRGLTDASYDPATGKFSFGDADVSFTAADDKGSNMLQALGLNGGGLQTADINQAKKINGQDAEIRLNGEIFTSSSNSFTINGLSIDAQAVTGDGDENAITINVSNDNQGIYDKVKDFLTQYNNIINEITKLYNADSAYGYDPLTDDEKDSMSDSQIEKWETKIKDSLLRRDNSLNTIMSSMINAMNKSVSINGKSYNLTSFGIHTLGYLNAVENEHNAFHIDGDSEDENTSSNEEKLMKAINEDPDTVVEFMKQLTSNLYKAIDDNMQSSSLRSRYKIYNDKEMDKQYTNYSKKISEWEDRIQAKEDYYYKKFTKMEIALGKLNSQTSSLSGLFGTN